MISFDADILFYAGDAGDAGDPGKRRHAQVVLDAAIDQRCAFLTVQCLAEFTASITRKKLLGRADAVEVAKGWAESFDVVAASADELHAALLWFALGRFSLWDGLLIATAIRGGATALISEDLADGTIIEGVEIINPFAESSDERLRRHGLKV